jgi:hypothetical protein
MKVAWRTRAPSGAALIILLIYFHAYAIPALRAHFAPDDMMNLAGYWRRGLWRTFADNLAFWSTAYRPLGGLYYLPLYRVFGLHPLPYHIAALTLVFAGVWGSYLVAARLAKSRAIGLAAAILCCAHGRMTDVYWNTSTIYDILARFFAMFTLLTYIRIRDRGKVPNQWQAALILLLFVAALDAKEIGIIAAPVLLAYEVFFHGPPRHWRWLKEEGAVPLAAVALALIYAAGKLFGSNALSNDEFYKIALSPGSYLDNNVSYAATIFYHVLIVSRPGVIVADLAMLLLLFSKRPILQWCAAYILIATLPISFIPTRGGSSLLLPLFGWALLAPSLLASLTLPKWIIRLALTLLCVVFAVTTASAWKRQSPPLVKAQEKTWRIIAELEALHFRPKPSSKVLIVNGPWEHGYDMLFIAQLVWNDPTIQIALSRTPPPPVGSGRIRQHYRIHARRRARSALNSPSVTPKENPPDRSSKGSQNASLWQRRALPIRLNTEQPRGELRGQSAMVRDPKLFDGAERRA